MLRKIIIACLFICQFTIAHANKVDSLKTLLDDDTVDKYTVYCNLSAALWESDSEQSKKYATQAIKIADEEGNENKKYKALRNYGMIYSINREYSKAIDVYNDILKYFKEIRDTIEIAALHRNIGDVYYRQAQFAEALKEYIYSENYFDKYIKIHDQYYDKVYENYGATLNNIGNVYLRLDDYEQAVKFFEQALVIQKETGDKYSEAAAYTNIGNIYHYLQKYEKSLQFYLNALECANIVNNITLKANINQNIATTYQNIKRYKEAQKFYTTALELYSQTDNNDGLMEIYHSLALSFFGERKIDSTEHYFDLAIKMAKYIQDFQYLSFIQYDKAQYYRENGKYEDAFKYLEQSQISKDSVLTKESREQINKLTVQYDTEKKDNLLKIKNLEMLKKENELYISLLVILALFIIVILIFRLYRNKNKNLNIIKEKNIAIERANYELEQQNEYINKQNIELSNLNSMKDKFFSIISHDMRNPITNMNLLLSLIESFCEVGKYDKIPDKLDKFKSSITNLMALFENLLVWSKTQTGSIKFNPARFNASEVIRHVAETFELNAEMKNIRFKIESNTSVLIDADKDMIEFIVRNLLSNAFKFTKSGGRVAISLIQESDLFKIIVTDSGIGLSKDNLANLFLIDHTYSRVGTASEKGSGLGLSIVKEFVALHQGNIEVNSEVGKGTEFIIILPQN